MKNLDFGVKEGSGLDFNMKSAGEEGNGISSSTGSEEGFPAAAGQPDNTPAGSQQSSGSENVSPENKTTIAADANNNGDAAQPQSAAAAANAASDFDISKIINPKTNKPLLEDYESLASQFSAVQTELAALKSAPPANTQTEQNEKDQEIIKLSTQLNQMMDFIKNPELIEFSKADDKTVEQWIQKEDIAKVKRFYDWKLQQQNNIQKTAEIPPANQPPKAPAPHQTPAPQTDALTETQKAEAERIKAAQKAKINEGLKELKDTFNEEWTENDVSNILQTLTGKEVAIIKYFREGKFDKILTDAQRETIMKSELDRKRIAAEQQPPHSAAANASASIPQTQEKKGKRNFMSIFGSKK